MPRHQTATELRLNDILTCLRSAVTLLNDVHDGFGTPFVYAISSTILSLITIVQNLKKNKAECILLIENVHRVLYAIVNLHIKSETMGTLLPATLYNIAKFEATLHQIHTFVEMQHAGNRFKQFFQQNEINTLLKGCQTGLQQALQVFQIDMSSTWIDIKKMQQQAEEMHKQLLEIISTYSDNTASDRSSFTYHSVYGSQDSSESFSMLPSRPKIFHGRESELKEIVNALNARCPRIAVLGPGGIGKTSLARAALHHPNIIAKYEHQFFVACDSATTGFELAALIGTHIGLQTGPNLKKPIVRYFTGTPNCLLILDNLETAWEPLHSRAEVEEFLSLLSDIPDLAMMITMRGAERPAKVQWTRPFLQPLQTLSNDAAWQTFVDIADDFHDTKDINQLLSLTGNIPLAIDLIAHLVHHEGCINILAKWETEKTLLLSKGHDRRSNLDTSIAVSLSSPRMTAGAKDLLSLLSILPDGLADVELLQSNLPIQNPLACKATLLRTSLAYTDDRKRLKSLVPIREHMNQFWPPTQALIQPLRKLFYSLLQLYAEYKGVSLGILAKPISSNIGNLRHLLSEGLSSDNQNLNDTLRCIIAFNSFCRLQGHGYQPLMDRLPALFPQPCDHRLEVLYASEVFSSILLHPIIEAEALISQAKQHFKTLHDPVLESRFHSAIGNYYFHVKKNIGTAMQCLQAALELSRSCENSNMQSTALTRLAEFEWFIGDYAAGQKHASEAIQLATLCGNVYAEARGLHTEATCCTALGHFKHSLLLLHRAEELMQVCGMLKGSMDQSIKNSRAEIHLQKSEYTEARHLHMQVLQDIHPEKQTFSYAFALLNIAEIDVLLGASGQDIHLNLDKAQTLFRTVQHSVGLIFCEMILGGLALREGDHLTARIIFHKSRETKISQFNTYCLERLADANFWDPADINHTASWAVVYLIHAIQSKRALILHKALCCLGDIFFLKGDSETAQTLFHVALEGFTNMDVHQSQAHCLMRLGDLAEQNDDPMKAIEFWSQSRPLFECAVQTRDVAGIDTRLAAAWKVQEMTLK